MLKSIKKSILTSIIIGIGIANFIATILFLYLEDKINSSFRIDPNLAADIGTYLAGTSGTLWGVAGLIVLIQTLQLQRNIFSEEKKQIKLKNFESKLTYRIDHLEKKIANCSFSKEYCEYARTNAPEHAHTSLNDGKQIENIEYMRSALENANPADANYEHYILLEKFFDLFVLIEDEAPVCKKKYYNRLEKLSGNFLAYAAYSTLNISKWGWNELLRESHIRIPRQRLVKGTHEHLFSGEKYIYFK